MTVNPRVEKFKIILISEENSGESVPQGSGPWEKRAYILPMEYKWNGGVSIQC